MESARFVSRSVGPSIATGANNFRSQSTLRKQRGMQPNKVVKQGLRRGELNNFGRVSQAKQL